MLRATEGRSKRPQMPLSRRSTTAPATLSRPCKTRRNNNSTSSQPIEINNTQPLSPRYPSPCRALAKASQATTAPLSSLTFKSRLRELQAKAAISAPTDNSHTATLSGTKARDKNNSVKATFNARFIDNFNRLD
jgi:hypothetical protein